MPSTKKKSVSRPSRRAKGPAEFAPNLFVGGWNDAVAFKGERFCVLDERPDDMPAGGHQAIVTGPGERIALDRLNKVVKAMRAAHERGRPVLVYCGHGVRRSPLAAAWYLHSVDGLTLDEAYARLEAVRPQVERPRDWLDNPEELEK